MAKAAMGSKLGEDPGMPAPYDSGPVMGVPLMQAVQGGSALPAFESGLLDVCEHGVGSCCEWAWCAPCMAAHLKADLDGRPCSPWDCLCGGFPNTGLALRRHLRQKYALELEISTTPCGFRKCSGTYWQDVWEPAVWATASSMLCGLPAAAAGPPAPNFSNLASSAVKTCFVYATAREERKRRGLSAATWSPHSPNLLGAPHAVGLYGCCEEPRLACRAFWCPCCVLGEATAMLQGRDYDCCDCVSAYPPYALRKSVQAKYGFHQPAVDFDDCCRACWCGCCMAVQDHRELTARQSRQGYLPHYVAI